MRLLRRRRSVPVGSFDAATDRWTDVEVAGDVERDELTLATFNIWLDSKYAEQRYLAIAELLSRRAPDIMVFQEVTPAALSVILAQPWIRANYLRAAIVGGKVDLPRHLHPTAHASVARVSSSRAQHQR